MNVLTKGIAITVAAASLTLASVALAATDHSPNAINGNRVTPSTQRLNYIVVNSSGSIILKKASRALGGGLTIYKTVDKGGNTISLFAVNFKNHVTPLTLSAKTSVGSSKTSLKNEAQSLSLKPMASCPCKIQTDPVPHTPLILVTVIGATGQIISQFTYNTETGVVTPVL